MSEAKAGGARGRLGRHFRAISAGFSASEILPAFEIPWRLLLGDRLARFPCTHTRPPLYPRNSQTLRGCPGRGRESRGPFRRSRRCRALRLAMVSPTRQQRAEVCERVLGGSGGRAGGVLLPLPSLHGEKMPSAMPEAFGGCKWKRVPPENVTVVLLQTLGLESFSPPTSLLPTFFFPIIKKKKK